MRGRLLGRPRHHGSTFMRSGTVGFGVLCDTNDHALAWRARRQKVGRMADTARKLRILIVDGHAERLREVTATVTSLGHDVVRGGVDLASVSQVTVSELPDVAFVIVGEESRQALELIRTIVHEAACPVIAILDVQDRAFIDQAARLGIFSYIAQSGDLQEMQSSIDISLERFAEYHALEGAFGRRAVTERAKGILMERHGLEEQAAFQLLRGEARRTNSKIVDVAESILASHRLLPGGKDVTPVEEGAFDSGKDL
jgi:AmiR/NasT family two-component response regulator